MGGEAILLSLNTKHAEQLSEGGSVESERRAMANARRQVSQENPNLKIRPLDEKGTEFKHR